MLFLERLVWWNKGASSSAFLRRVELRSSWSEVHGRVRVKLGRCMALTCWEFTCGVRFCCNLRGGFDAQFIIWRVNQWIGSKSIFRGKLIESSGKSPRVVSSQMLWSHLHGTFRGLFLGEHLLDMKLRRDGIERRLRVVVWFDHSIGKSVQAKVVLIWFDYVIVDYYY